MASGQFEPAGFTARYFRMLMEFGVTSERLGVPLAMADTLGEGGPGNRARPRRQSYGEKRHHRSGLISFAGNSGGTLGSRKNPARRLAGLI